MEHSDDCVHRELCETLDRGGGEGEGEGWCRSSMLTRIDTSFQPSSPSHLERHPSRGKTWL